MECIKLRDKDVKALRLFKEDYPEANVYLLYGGSQKLNIDGIPALPIEQVLREPMVVLSP